MSSEPVAALSANSGVVLVTMAGRSSGIGNVLCQFVRIHVDHRNLAALKFVQEAHAFHACQRCSQTALAFPPRTSREISWIISLRRFKAGSVDAVETREDFRPKE